MHEYNITNIFLLGFPKLHGFYILFFVFLVILFCVTICGNVLIITLVALDRHLHSPMYFFISQISILDILMTTDIVPFLLHIVLHDGGFMSLGACLSQFYVFANCEASECLFLTVMSYDRYVAICNPLRYNAVINKTFCIKSMIVSGILSFFIVLVNELYIYRLDFCGPNVIDHFFCDLTPLIDLSCSNSSSIKIFTIIAGILVIISPFIIIIVSYAFIINTILNISSNTGRQKAFSTCSSHLTVVCIFFGTLLSVYTLPAIGSQLLSNIKTLSLLYTVVTPLLNPFIYSLRNKDFKEAFGKLKQYLFRSKITDTK